MDARVNCRRAMWSASGPASMAVEWPAQAGERRSSIATSRLMRPSADRKRRQSRQSAHSVPLR
jgi:hypothetical protein